MKTLTPQRIAYLQNMLTAAQRARQSGMSEQAERLYHDILKEAPEAWDVHHQLAVLLAMTGRSQEAAKHFRLIVKANPSHAMSHANLGNALAECGQVEEAIIEYRRAVALDPRLAWAHIGLAAALRKAEKPEEAIEHYKAALNLDKVNHAAFNGLGLAYRDMGDFPRALEALEHAVGIAPENADYRLNFGITLIRFEQEDLATQQFYEAVNLRPNSLEAMTLLAESLQRQQRLDEAKECLDRALMLKPNDPELLERRGFVYLDMGDAERALDSFGPIAKLHPERPLALLGLGRSHLEAGHSADAIVALERLVDQYPDADLGYYYLATSRKFKADDPVIPKMKKLESEIERTNKRTASLDFALGKIYDDCKQWDEAFTYYSKGNKLRNEEYDYQPSEQEAEFEALINVFSREFIAQHQDLGTQSKLPIFIVGMPRSGTTLTEQIISSHPQVVGAGEMTFWRTALHAFPYDLNSQLDYPQCLDVVTPEKTAVLAERYIEQLKKIAGMDACPSRITDKMPHNFMHIGLLALLFPEAPIINCKRDPMDNCLSIFFQNFGGVHPYAYDLSNIGHHYKQYERLMAHWHEVLPGRILDINYEDTIADPEYWSRKLIEHVGLEWDDACLAPHKLERTVKTASHWQVRQPIYKTSVQRWKNYEKHLGPLKAALGLE